MIERLNRIYLKIFPQEIMDGTFPATARSHGRMGFLCPGRPMQVLFDISPSSTERILTLECS